MVKPEVLTLVTYKHLVYLCRNQEQFDWVAKKYNANQRNWLANANSVATTHNLKDKSLVVVALPKKKLDAYWASIAAHEATHVMQYVFYNLGELDAGMEPEAYLVEQVTKFLLEN